ncbi:hypothetical protein [Nocardia neocaledoniensis]|uniref:hypothetical protein n=1 Tax=Nocardia neocaledoniensis TaxID=236511 RepID=UPI00245890C0|nr:hypothetical protein [Nocardia neocaledoniensis]
MTDSRTRIHAAAWFLTGAATTVTAAAAVTAWDMFAVTAKLRAALARASMSPTERAAADRVLADLKAEHARLLADRDDHVEQNRLAIASQYRPDLMLTPVLDVVDLSVQALTDELAHALNQLDEAYDRWINRGASDGEAEATMWRGHLAALGDEVFQRRFIQHGYASLSKADQLRLDIAEQKRHMRTRAQGIHAQADPTT